MEEDFISEAYFAILFFDDSILFKKQFACSFAAFRMEVYDDSFMVFASTIKSVREPWLEMEVW